MKNHELAISDFNSAIGLEPGYPEIYYFRGISLLEQAKYQEAIQDFNYSLELGSKNPSIFSGIGQAFRLLKNYEKALYYLNFALEKNTDNDEYMLQRSNIFVDIKQFQLFFFN